MWLLGALLGLALLAPTAVFASDLQGWQAWPLALVACGWGLLDAKRYWQYPKSRLRIPAGSAAALCNDEPMLALQLHTRGPLVFLSWRDRHGRNQRRVWGPGTLTCAQRRELRLAMQQRAAANTPASVAG